MTAVEAKTVKAAPLADHILGSHDRQLHPVYVPEWECKVYISELSAAEAEAFARETSAADGSSTMARFLVRCLTDEQGRPIFAPDQADALAQKSATVLRRLFEKGQQVNAGDELEKAAGKV